MLKIALFIAALIFSVLPLIIALQPNEFKVSRSLLMTAPPSRIFAEVNDLHRWKAWSPWAKLDTDAKETYEGAQSGVGAVMHWDGNMQVGKGSMTIIENKDNEFVRFRLNFLKPMENASRAEFTFKEQGGKTLVTWSMYGKNNFIGKAMSLVFNCEKMVGGQFEKGLASLQTVVETPAPASN